MISTKMQEKGGGPGEGERVTFVILSPVIGPPLTLIEKLKFIFSLTTRNLK